MLYLVRENPFIGNINAAAKVLLDENKKITHIISVLTSASIGFFLRMEVEFFSSYQRDSDGVYGGSDEDESLEGRVGSDKSESCSKKIQHVVENAGGDLKLVRMVVPLRDMESENLLDSLEVCLDFIDESRKKGSVLVHCFAGVSRSLLL